MNVQKSLEETRIYTSQIECFNKMEMKPPLVIYMAVHRSVFTRVARVVIEAVN